MYFIRVVIDSPLNPTKQKIKTGKIVIIEIGIIILKELKNEFKIKKIKTHQIIQKIAVE